MQGKTEGLVNAKRRKFVSLKIIPGKIKVHVLYINHFLIFLKNNINW